MDNDPSFEVEQPGSIANIKHNLPTFSKLKSLIPEGWYIPDFNTLKTIFEDKYNEATWKNVHKFLLNSCKNFYRAEFFMALQCVLLIYFPGMALGIVYQYYELDVQQQMLQSEQDDEEIYDVILQEIPHPQSQWYIKQTLDSQGRPTPSMSQSIMSEHIQSQSPMIQFVQFISRIIEQLIQTPQAMLEAIQYQQYCQYIHQKLQGQQMQQQQSNPYRCDLYQQMQEEEEEMSMIAATDSQCIMVIQLQQQQQTQQPVQQVIIVTMKQQVYAPTNSAQHNENGGGTNTIILVIRVKLPGEGRQVIKFR